jgi:hypothetical protein
VRAGARVDHDRQAGDPWTSECRPRHLFCRHGDIATGKAVAG